MKEQITSWHTAVKQFKQVSFVQIYKLWLFVPDCSRLGISSSLQNLLSCLSSPETKSSGYFGWKCCSSLPLSSTDSLPWLRAHLLSFTASIKSSLSSLQLSTDREWITSSSRLSAAATLLTFSSSLYLCWGLAQLVPARLSVALERINGM